MAELNHTTQPNNWARDLVLIAKNTIVWLNQLSQKYRREIKRLDQIPEEELGELSARGINGLWLVGVWQRSPASQKIKHLYGRLDAISSAYSINDYTIADELGGEDAFLELKHTAKFHGIHLACDMVANHTGLDSPWVIHNPERFITIDENPHREFEFNTQNLSDYPSTAIYLEEGYYNQSKAAEVFRYQRKSESRERFIYHGNDGTSMPWNDTAQLNYLNPETRQAVMNEIIAVANKFDIIRLDAAMTLIKKHFKRLWFPSKGGEKFIPTRGNFYMTEEEFDQFMPEEFWKEVITELKSKAPHTLLIAEAFWLMEKFFLNEIGMHRVYNSAFMNLLKKEKNREYREYLKDFLQTDPLLLERFVNYLTTPDEDTAIEQFGKSEKYFGLCRLMATIPGLPMFGHGQWEGLKEKYSMDMDRPMLEENADENLMSKHKELVTPLLRQRGRFSSAAGFTLYDFLGNGQSIDENVIAFSNTIQNQRSMVFFNNYSQFIKGTILSSVKQRFHEQPEKPKRVSLLEGLCLDSLSFENLLLLDFSNNKKSIISKKNIQESGLAVELKPYECQVYKIEIA